MELILDDENRLAGLPESSKQAAQQMAFSKGYGSEDAPKWRFTLDYPSYIPVMRYAEDADLRKEMFSAMSAVGRNEGFNNLPVIQQILNLRQEKAVVADHFRTWF